MYETTEKENVLKSRSFSDIHKFHIWQEFKWIRKTSRWKDLRFNTEPFQSSSETARHCRWHLLGYPLTKPSLSQWVQVPFTVGYEVDTNMPSKLVCFAIICSPSSKRTFWYLPWQHFPFLILELVFSLPLPSLWPEEQVLVEYLPLENSSKGLDPGQLNNIPKPAFLDHSQLPNLFIYSWRTTGHTLLLLNYD